ncbi:MAG: HEAT repeat domain-containing protein [Planctomycetota bacterium]
MVSLGVCHWQLAASAILRAITHKTLAGKPPVAPGAMLSALLALVVLAGCSSSNHRWSLKRRSSQAWLDMALEAPTPDERRKGVVGLAESNDATSSWAMQVFDTVARTDTDPMVRRAAIRAMCGAADSSCVPTALKLLKSSDERLGDVRPAPGPVRCEAAKLLQVIVRDYAFEESQRQEIVEALLDRLERDQDRGVRLTTVDMLGYFTQRPIPSVLVEVLESEDDFALQHAAEDSLIVLTGTTHHHDPAAWRRWLRETADPFEHAGELPEEMAPQERKSWWRFGK